MCRFKSEKYIYTLDLMHAPVRFSWKQIKLATFDIFVVFSISQDFFQQKESLCSFTPFSHPFSVIIG